MKKAIKENTISLLDRVLKYELLSEEERETYTAIKEELEMAKDEKTILNLVIAIIAEGNIAPDFFNNT